MRKYNMQFSWCIYQTRTVKYSKKLTKKIMDGQMQHEKKYSLIPEPRDLIKNTITERVLFHRFRTTRLLLRSLN